MVYQCILRLLQLFRFQMLTIIPSLYTQILGFINLKLCLHLIPFVYNNYTSLLRATLDFRKNRCCYSSLLFFFLFFFTIPHSERNRICSIRQASRNLLKTNRPTVVVCTNKNVILTCIVHYKMQLNILENLMKNSRFYCKNKSPTESVLRRIKAYGSSSARF